MAWFEGPDFVRSVDTPDEVIVEEAWLTCSPCLDLVRADDRDALIDRAKRRHEGSTEADTIERTLRESHERFWGPRSG